MKRGGAGPMKLRTISFLWVALVGSLACGGTLADPSQTADAGRRRDGGRDAASDQTSEASPGLPDAESDVFEVYAEDACSDAPLEVPPLECDPFAAKPCTMGRACYPIPPHGTDSCHPGRYGTKCLPEGPGTQGSPCSDGSECRGGYLCVKTGAGDMCVKLCKLSQLGSCTDGRVCREVDVTGSGWGGCE
jgi:hypothetical protein